MASSSSQLLLLALLLAVSSSSPSLPVMAVQPPGDRLTHICVYMHETVSGRHATMLRSVQSPMGSNSMFGTVNVLDNELRDGPDRGGSRLVGRFQGLFVGSGVVSPPGLMTSMNVVFTAGKYGGGTLALLGPVLNFEAPVERSLVGGTGRFRMAHGYSVMTSVGNYTKADSVVLIDKIDLYVKIRRQRITVPSSEKSTPVFCKQKPILQKNHGEINVPCDRLCLFCKQKPIYLAFTSVRVQRLLSALAWPLLNLLDPY